MAKLENEQWELFARLSAKGYTRADAAKAAKLTGKNKQNLAANAQNLMKRHPEVKARISEIQNELRVEAIEATDLNREFVITGLRENFERAMEAKPVLDREGNPTGEFTYTGSVANRSLELMGKELGMFADRLILDNLDEELEKMSPEQLRSYVRSIAGEVGLRVVEMNHDEIREYIVTQAPRVGLRVEEGGEGSAGAEAEEDRGLQPVSEAAGISQSRKH